MNDLYILNSENEQYFRENNINYEIMEIKISTHIVDYKWSSVGAGKDITGVVLNIDDDSYLLEKDGIGDYCDFSYYEGTLYGFDYKNKEIGWEGVFKAIRKIL
ncbi:hypothetical protein Catovirus_1_148 [Catovirus CTV1]|uniref:Uncharacterized protein n=1 Tax=Catovirus CTV1 TaxID=1977631 RepID=A0A1V0S8Y2_9VIRU|nr:hypothetical protein Catovirus_1_148 [Catovirus CTV1]